MTFFAELRRRNVVRVGIAYLLFAWVLLQGADFALDLFGAPNWVIQALSVVAAIGLPLVLILAWAFELTPEGIKRERDVDRSASITTRTGRKLDRVIIAVLAVVVAYLLVDKLLLQDLVLPKESTAQSAAAPGAAADVPGASVAVLPFVNMSGDADNEYFSDGLTETLLHMLSQLPGLRVAARTSSFAFKGQNRSVAEIATALGVAHILEGSVQKANDRVRVTAQLIRADDGFHVWSQNYTRPLQDIFAIQDEIAEDVAHALGSSLLGEAEPNIHGVSTTDVVAYDSYLKGLEQQALFSYGSLGEAESFFKQALARDPAFVEARLALVRNEVLSYQTGLIDETELRRRVDPQLRQVRASDPDNPLARALELTMELGIFDSRQDAEARREQTFELQSLLEQLPAESFPRRMLSEALYSYLRDSEHAIEVLRKGLQIDPLEGQLHHALGAIYLDEHRLDEARASLTRGVELVPGNPGPYSAMSKLELEADNLPAALDWARRACEVDPQDHELAAEIARLFYELRLPEEGDYWRARVDALAPGSSIAMNLAVERAAAREETAQALDLSAEFLGRYTDDRQRAFLRTQGYYIDKMLEAGRAREAYDFLVGVRPEITHYDELLPDQTGLAMQWGSILLMTGFESFETRRATWETFTGRLDAMGIPWKSDKSDTSYTWDYLMRGENDKAVAHYLEYELQKPLALSLERHRKPMSVIGAPIYADPRVAAGLAEDAERYAALRENVQEMLRRPEWQL